ncbi:MAG: peptide chain release factor N(5)-glutamine methyltransferase [Clostridia bacterium]|nr:peptide chain release factor N(5)-glutamine methyltransferase [Clostridia bacterium]
MKEEKNKQKTCTSIGGQAVMEGVMMRGKRSMATAVRDPQGHIQIESERLTPSEEKSRFSRLPFIRGVVNFVQSLVLGNRILMRSAEVAESEDEAPTKAEKWLTEKHKIDVNGLFNGLAVVIGVLLAVGLFVFLPQLLVEWTGLGKKLGKTSVWYNLIEGGIRIAIFVAYILLISLIPTLKRVFMYHGAEHKTITCFELGKDLTTENVRGCSRVHDRCGTTFLFLVMVVSILVFSLANFLIGGWLYTGNEKLDFFIRFFFKLLFLPVVAGVSYEILKLLAKTKNKFFLIFKIPGLLLQRLTTSEPTDDMIECAVTAFKKVLEMDADPSVPETVFVTSGKMSSLLENTKKRFSRFNIEEDEAEWIFALTLNIPKSAVATEERILKLAQAKEIVKIVDERLTGRPLWYIFGDADFYGYKIKVDERVLIPRRETEELAELTLTAIEDGDSVLDLCTGSGAVAISVYKEAQKRGKQVSVTAVDISKDALVVAKENAAYHKADIKFVQSDLFAKIRGSRFNVIVSNPPYIPSAEIETLQREVKDYEPRLALDGGADGLDFYRRIAEDASKFIAKGGVVIMEVGIGEADKVVKMFKYCDYAMIIKDMQGVDRFVKIVF